MHAVTQRRVVVRRVLRRHPRCPGIAADGRRVALIATGRLGASREFVEPGVEELQHRCAMAVRMLVLTHAPQVLLAQRADAMPQISEWQLVVVRYR